MNVISRTYQKIRRLQISHSANPRPSSNPFISGDSFRSLAKHKWDVDHEFTPLEVKAGDTVYLPTHKVFDFFKEHHPHILNPYILITHYSTDSITAAHLPLIDEKIIHWFSKNVSVEHPKLTPLPIGLEDFCYYQNGIPENFKTIRKNLPGVECKFNKVLYGFSVDTNPTERTEALTYLKKINTAALVEGKPTPYKYLQQLTKHKFVASPPGRGEDCHRTWEAFYVHTIPIVKSSYLTRFFADKGLPLLLIENWNEIELFNESFLTDYYNKNQFKFENAAIWFEYWQNLIKEQVKMYD